MPGQYKIVVTTQTASVEDPSGRNGAKSPVPGKYANLSTTTLTLDVKDEGKPVTHDVQLD